MEIIEKKVSIDSFIELLKSNNMSTEEATDLVNSIYNTIHERYNDENNKEEKTPRLDEADNNNRNKIFAEFYDLVKNIYNIEQLKNSTQQVRNEIVKKIMQHCKSAVTKVFNSWDYTKINDFIKLLFEKFNDTNSDRIIECIGNYAKCEKKDLIDKTINKLIKENEKLCNIEEMNRILEGYNFLSFYYNQYEKKNKGKDKKINLENTTKLAELCIEKIKEEEEKEENLSISDIAELFENVTNIIKYKPELYYENIEENFELVRDGRLRGKEAINNIIKIANDLESQNKDDADEYQEQFKELLNEGIGNITERIKSFTHKKKIADTKTDNSENKKTPNSLGKKMLQASIIFLAGLATDAFFIPNVIKGIDGEEQQYEELMEAIYDDVEDTGYVENLPISIKCNVIKSIEPYGPEEESLAIARVSITGEMKAIIWKDSDGTYKTITNNLNNYMKCLNVVEGTRKTKIIADCKGEDEKFKKGDIVEIVDGPIPNDEGVEMVTVRKDGGYNNTISYEYTEESKIYPNSVLAYARSLKEEVVDDTTKIKPQEFTFIMDYTDPNSEVEYMAGESILGYLTVENGEPVVKKAKTVNGENNDITIPFWGYFSTDNREVETQPGLMDRISRENGGITTEQPLYTWDDEYDGLASIIPPNEKIQIMMYEKEDGFHLIGTTYNIELGDLAGYDVYEELENYTLSLQPEEIDAYIDEHYIEGESTTYYYNGIFVPKEIANKDIGKYLDKQIFDINEGKKMPNTENSNSDITYIEITKDTDIIKRLKNVTKNTGLPYGLYIKYGSGEITKDDVENIVSQIKNSEYKDYFQGGIIIKPTGLPEKKYQLRINEDGEYEYDEDGNPTTEINPDYLEIIEKTNNLINSLNELGIKIFILDSNNSSLDVDDITSNGIKYALEAKRDNDNRLNDEINDYYQQKYVENSKEISIWLDIEKGHASVDVAIVKEALKAIAAANKNPITMDAVITEERP